jgi:hypothetical protein
MTLYRKHAQGETVKGDFSLTYDNIDRYHTMAKSMDDEVRWAKTVINLRNKRDYPELNADSLYTPEYIARRLEKITLQRPITGDLEELIKSSQELDNVEREMAKMRPLVFDPEEGKKVEHHERMSELNDRFNALEEQINSMYARKYGELQLHLPKIYYMILEGVDMDTVNSCFNKMKSVLSGRLTTEEAASKLMDESQTKYNLPKTIYDPIRMNRRGGSNANSGTRGKPRA